MLLCGVGCLYQPASKIDLKKTAEPKSKPAIGQCRRCLGGALAHAAVEPKETVAEREGDDNVVVVAVGLAVGVRLVEGGDDGGVPAGEVVAGVGWEADLVVGDGVGDDVVTGGAGMEADEAACGLTRGR
jgi:hypothetical protein